MDVVTTQPKDYMQFAATRQLVQLRLLLVGSCETDKNCATSSRGGADEVPAGLVPKRNTRSNFGTSSGPFVTPLKNPGLSLDPSHCMLRAPRFGFEPVGAFLFLRVPSALEQTRPILCVSHCLVSLVSRDRPEKWASHVTQSLPPG